MSQVSGTMTRGLIAELGDRLLQAPAAKRHMKRVCPDACVHSGEFSGWSSLDFLSLSLKRFVEG